VKPRSEGAIGPRTLWISPGAARLLTAES
jgi:hypothetical protein